jgi:gliding motility-associated-like protein
MSGSTTNLTYNDIALGDRLSFIIRSYTKSGIISSSSNLLTFVTRRPIAPLNLYLSNITVNDEKLEVYFKVTEINDTWQLRILKGTNRTNLTDMFTINKEDIIVDNLYIDENVNVAETRYYYQIESLDKCNTLLSVSNISSNIVLQIGDNLEHNEYDGWINGVKEYELLQSLDNGSTWNTVRVSEELLSSNLIPTAAGCFIVQASETPNNTFKTTSISRSNTVCIVEEMTSFIVTAVNPTSANNRFTITGSGINHSTSFYQIYNRWGELLVQNPTNESWDLVYNQQLIPLGRYIYIVHLYGTLGEKKIVKGTLNVIR